MGSILNTWGEGDTTVTGARGPDVGPLVPSMGPQAPGVGSHNTGFTTTFDITTPLRSTSREDVDAYIRENYGQMAGFINHPEIGKILREAALGEFDYGKLYGRVVATDWWKNTSAAQRTWQQLASEDPAEARRLVNQTAATMNNRAKSLGLNLSAAQIGGMATTATVNGWTDAQTVDQLMQQVNWATLKAGDLTAKRDEVMTIAGDYLVGVSASTAQSYAEAMASGEMSPQGVRSAMMKQAKARFGYLSSELDQGMTVKQYFAPVANRIEQELELGSGSVDMMDSKWLSMLEKTGDDGKLRAATLHEATQMARKDSRWANTQKAQEQTTNMMSSIGRIFGRTAI
jgi:urease gamma subunit